jgi:hypothetical protein
LWEIKQGHVLRNSAFPFMVLKREEEKIYGGKSWNYDSKAPQSFTGGARHDD